MIVAQVRRTVLARALLPSGATVVAACSGGADSVAMLHALSRLAPELGISLHVASVDHGLRPEACHEVAAVGRLAGELGHAFHPLEVSVSRRENLQAQARDRRYEALLGLAAELGAGLVATGHSRDDQAETVLLRVLRGSGIGGLSGVAPRRDDGVVRPVIDVSRAELRAHVQHHGLAFVEDPSNQDRSFARVRMRAQLLPQLAAENPEITKHLANLADDARAVGDLLERVGAQLRDQAEVARGLAIAPLAAAGLAERRAALQSWLSEATTRKPTRAHLEALDALVSGRGEVLLPGGYRVRVEAGTLVLEGRSERR